MASDLIERTTHGGGETSSGAIPAGVSLRPVLRGGISGEEMTAIPEGTPIIIFRAGGTAGGSARGSLSSIGGREEWSISEIPARNTWGRRRLP